MGKESCQKSKEFVFSATRLKSGTPFNVSQVTTLRAQCKFCQAPTAGQEGFGMDGASGDGGESLLRRNLRRCRRWRGRRGRGRRWRWRGCRRRSKMIGCSPCNSSPPLGVQALKWPDQAGEGCEASLPRSTYPRHPSCASASASSSPGCACVSPSTPLPALFPTQTSCTPHKSSSETRWKLAGTWKFSCCTVST